MPFTAHDLRYRAEQNYPLLYAYLQRNAQRFLGALQYDAFEVDTVVGHVVEQLVRLGLFGGADKTPLTALDQLTDAQFYAFLNRCVRNKAIDRLRKRRIPVTAAAELEGLLGGEGEGSPLEEVATSLWNATPFATPEEITLHLVSQKELRDLLKQCIQSLSKAPNQLHAVLQELQEIGADELLMAVLEELHLSWPSSPNEPRHASQHKDHAHKKLRFCLQQRSPDLTVLVALRLTLYKTLSSPERKDYSVSIQALAQHDLSEEEVRASLQELVVKGLLGWNGEDPVSLTDGQMKRLARFYKAE